MKKSENEEIRKHTRDNVCVQTRCAHKCLRSQPSTGIRVPSLKRLNRLERVALPALISGWLWPSQSCTRSLFWQSGGS